MTVAELIVELQRQAPHKPVRVRCERDLPRGPHVDVVADDPDFDPLYMESDADVVTNEGAYVLIDSK